MSITASMTDLDRVAGTGVIGGVDTHKDVHVAAVIDQLGRLAGTESFPTTTAGYARMVAWMSSFGDVLVVGVEGTGCYGAGLARHLTAAGISVIEVNRPNRQFRRRHGKSDTADAIAAAKAVLSGDATGVPKASDGQVEAIRMLRVARRGALKERTSAAGQIHNVITTCPEPLRQDLAGLTTSKLVERCSRLRPGTSTGVTAAAKTALVSIARRWIAAQAEIDVLDVALKELVEAVAPELVAMRGVGIDTAGALLVAAGDNPERMRSEAAFAALCGTSPVDASSGKVVRRRLNQGGNREANSALWRIVLVRLSVDQPTKDYMARRTAEGRSKREIMRCLKRYVARQVFNVMRPKPTPEVLAIAA
jgi:transposase